jgi:XTP/dITP diphosphohydrolase
MDLLIATTNAGKVREIRQVLGGLPVTIKTLLDFPNVAEAEETASTFAGNALLKAEYYARACLWPTVAEDSGLAIHALGGRPGVESARYPGATYPDKFRNLYRELDGHARPWTAQYVCSLAFVDRPASGQGPPAVLFTCEDTVEGEIWPVPVGGGGFGYDPIFYYPSFQTTFGNVSDAQKLTVAHRGKAFRRFAEWLKAELA